MAKKFAGVLILLFSLGGSSALAQKVELTPFWGYRVGGGFDDISIPGIEELEVDDGDNYGINLGFAMGERGQLEVLWSHQTTDLDIDPVLGSSTTLFGIDVDYFHVGGLYMFGEDKFRPFVSFSMGLTYFDPPSGFDSDDQFSFSLGGGLKYYFNERLGVRLQGKWTSTYINSTNEGYFCDPFGFCYTVSDSNYMYQTSFDAGLIVRF